jgi:hypothetical protein
MKNIIILLTTILSVYNCKASSSVRHPKKNSFIRVKNKQQNAINNTVLVATTNQNNNNNKIPTLKGFKSMELLNPDFLNQPATKNSVNNTNKVPNKVFPVGNTLYNNQQNSNQIVNNNSVAKNTQAVPYNNNHITNSAPITLANQMNTIYNGNKQNQSPQGSAYANYQSSINNSYAGGLSQQPVQPQLINPPLQSNQQLLLPINNNQMNNNQNQSNLGVYYGNYQNL